MTWVVEFSMNYERKHAKRDGALETVRKSL